ncbi:metal ABC transporter substrate-binding protein [Pikeienuella piscinae]|uniref:Metal ABC transporter substrate-binding protein n=1 Tax=Pikeienuella piscinae TaxID=2748098 RepID=A0A7L5C4J3_9RHOB|nr:metal ABC transporter substrate-binding protein [Pikeienuella piscinae]QIE56859.1 metal ABC transporter substrate-binding protein [Pikeienuella piscinae]
MILRLAALCLTIIYAAGPAAADRLKAVTTFTVIADIAANVAGDAAEVVSITRPGAEIHNYQPTPRDILKAQDADLIIWNGLNLELWFEKFFQSLRDVPDVVASDGVEPISIADGPYTGKPNPHAWMSPEDGKIYVANIRDAFIRLDPTNEAVYRANAAAYMAEIDAVAAPIRKELEALPEGHRWLVTGEGAFSYLARDFGLKELFLWPINADQQGTPSQVRHVIDVMRAENIPVIFSESTVSPKPSQQVAREVGARYGGVLYVDSLSEPGGPAPTYLDLLRVTSETIVKGLSQ